jgi:4-amino-4-deoxy-L-arabinose transferase-like glycosyltransferase
MSWRQIFKDRYFLVALAVSLVLHIGFFVAAEPWDSTSVESRLLVNDAQHYHDAAVGLTEGEGFDAIPTFRTPGYPLFVATIYKVFGTDRLWMPLAVQVVINLMVLAFVFRIARELTKSLYAARFAAGLFALSFLSTFYATRLLTESLFTLVFLATIWAFFKAVKANSLLWFTSSGILLGVTTMVRPTTQFYGLVIIVAILLAVHATGRRKILAVAVFAVANILVLAPWIGHNLDKHGSPQLTSIQGHIAMEFMAADIVSRSEGISLTEAREQLVSELPETDNPFDLSKEKAELTASYVVGNPILFARKTIEGVVRSYAGTGQHIVVHEVLQLDEQTDGDPGEILSDRIKNVIDGSVTELIIGVLLLGKMLGGHILLAFGLILLMRRRERVLPVLVVATAAYFGLAAGAIGIGDGRLVVPLMPLFAVVSGVGAVLLWERVLRMKWRSVTVS